MMFVRISIELYLYASAIPSQSRQPTHKELDSWETSMPPPPPHTQKKPRKTFDSQNLDPQINWPPKDWHLFLAPCRIWHKLCIISDSEVGNKKLFDLDWPNFERTAMETDYRTTDLFRTMDTFKKKKSILDRSLFIWAKSRSHQKGKYWIQKYLNIDIKEDVKGFFYVININSNQHVYLPPFLLSPNLW